MKHLFVEPELEAREIASVAAAALRPPVLPRISDWARKNYWCVGRIKQGILWDVEHTPQWIPILDALHPDSPIRKVSVMAAVQIGKTRMGLAAMFYTLVLRGEDVLFVFPAKQGGADAFVKSQIMPEVRIMERAGVLKTGGEKMLEREGIRHRIFRDAKTNAERGHLISAYASAEGTVSSISAYFILQDELDTNLASGKASMVSAHKKAEQRAAGRADDLKELLLSSPKRGKGKSLIEFEVDASDLQLKYHVPCPHCRVPDILKFDNLRFNRHAKSKQKMGDVFYECPHCAGRVEEHHKRGMLAAGRWLDQKGREFNADDPEEGATSIGLWMSSMYSPTSFMTWRRLAEICQEAYVTEDPNTIKDFRNAYLAETVTEAINVVTEKDVEVRVKERPVDYRLGQVPPGYEYLVSGVDVGLHKLDYITLGVSEYRRAALVDVGSIAIERGLRDQAWLNLLWATMGTLLVRRDGNGLLPILGQAVDLGGSAQTDSFAWSAKVFEYQDAARRLAFADPKHPRPLFKNIFPVRSDSMYKRQDVVWMGEWNYAKEKGVETGLHLEMHWVNSDRLKDTLMDMFFNEDEDGIPKLLLPSDLEARAPRFVREFTSEEKLPVSKFGRPKWQLKQEGRANHYLDCMVYALSLLYQDIRLNYDAMTEADWANLRRGVVPEGPETAIAPSPDDPNDLEGAHKKAVYDLEHPKQGRAGRPRRRFMRPARRRRTEGDEG